MSPTRPALLASVAVISSVLGWAVADLWRAIGGRSLPVPVSSAITVAALALVLTVWTEMFRRRLRVPQPVNPFVAVRSAALGMAASRAGAIIFGVFAGVGMWYATDLDTGLARQRALTCALGALAAIAVVAAGVWLERVCRIPPSEDDDGPDPPNSRDIGGDWVHPRERLELTAANSGTPRAG